MSVRRIDRDDVRARFDERGHALHCICGSTDRRADEETAVFIPRGIGILNGLFNVFNRNESFKVPFSVHNGKFFYPVFSENLLCFFERSPHGSRNQPLLGHHVGDRLFIIIFKAEIPIGKYPHQLSVLRDGNAADTILFHERNRVFDEIFRFQKEGVGDNAVFTALYFVYLFRLLFDRHIFVNNADAAFPRNGDRHSVFGDCIHGCADERYI